MDGCERGAFLEMSDVGRRVSIYELFFSDVHQMLMRDLGRMGKQRTTGPQSRSEDKDGRGCGMGMEPCLMLPPYETRASSQRRGRKYAVHGQRQTYCS